MPGSVLVGAATVTLIHDDEVKEAGRKFTVKLLTILRDQ